MNILVIDDRPEIGRILHRNFSDGLAQIHVIQATGILDALGAVEELRPQIVIVKSQLPSGSTGGLIQQVKHSLPDTKVILLTDTDDFTPHKRAMRWGIDYFCCNKGMRVRDFELLYNVAHVIEVTHETVSSVAVRLP